MKIRYALMSCNGEMDYLGYWPITAVAWRKLGITPVLFFIPDSDVTEPPPADGIVHTLEPLADVEMGVQYTWARLWGTQFYPDDVVVVSDIDMLPLSRHYFVDQLENIPDHHYVHLDPLHPYYHSEPPAELVPRNLKRFQVAYHVALGSLFKEVLALPEDWGQAAREVAPYYGKAPMYKRPYSSVWDGDESYSTMKIHSYEKQSIFRLLLRENSHPFDRRQKWWGKLIRNRRIEKWCLCVWDPALRRQGHYLDAELPVPCTLRSLELGNLLLEGDPPPGKVEKSLAMEEDCLKRYGGFSFEVIFPLRLFLLACFRKNHSLLDGACSRLVVLTIVRRLITGLRLRRLWAGLQLRFLMTRLHRLLRT